MLTRDNFTEEYIRELQGISKRDPALIERTIYAFGLLEAIARVGMPFIFKGGTCLMLLLKHPQRLSTDIDIVVEPGTDVEEYIEKASKIFPFVRYEEQIRKGKNSIEKRHFKFTYDSPVNGREFYILLDVLYEENHYERVVECEIKNELLLTEPEMLKVKVPSIECILGDKLTAFAPHTTGIPLGEGKDMEVMKQLFDVSTLKFLVIATGGIPRDFMTSFCEAVRISKRDGKERIGKDQIYEVIKNLKTDKDNNIEVDSELPTDKIECAIEVINTEIIRNMRTNVILYPVEKAEQHEKLLRNLTNLRYLHLIKSKMTSEKTKQECRAYLIDMTFYACARIPSSFNFCEFWVMDDASRLNNLRRAPVWSFPEESVREILS